MTTPIAEFTGETRWLSNFHPCPIIWRTLTHPSVEHAYQAAKFISLDIRMQFTTGTPGQAKRLGRTFKVRDNWQSVKLDIMHELLLQKFAIPELRDKLIATHPAQLIEGNWWGDTYWGVSNHTGKGHNHLGRLLMQIRKELV